MNKNSILAIAITLVLAGAIGFFAGTKYQQGKRRNFPGTGNQMGESRMNGVRNGFRPMNGEIIASDDQSITVKAADGSSKIVLITDKTEINKADSATKDDLKTGEKVVVIGSENADGSITAQNVQLNPIIRALPSPTPQP